MRYSVGEILKVKQMLDVLNYRDDPALPDILRAVAAAYRPYRPDQTVIVTAADITIHPCNAEPRLPLDKEEKDGNDTSIH
ncbi:MAG: hypothetical protein AB1641_09825 [Thermodesulfobacteriota bacterium]